MDNANYNRKVSRLKMPNQRRQFNANIRKIIKFDTRFVESKSRSRVINEK